MPCPDNEIGRAGEDGQARRQHDHDGAEHCRIHSEGQFGQNKQSECNLRRGVHLGDEKRCDRHRSPYPGSNCDGSEDQHVPQHDEKNKPGRQMPKGTKNDIDTDEEQFIGQWIKPGAECRTLVETAGDNSVDGIRKPGQKKQQERQPHRPGHQRIKNGRDDKEAASGDDVGYSHCDPVPFGGIWRRNRLFQSLCLVAACQVMQNSEKTALAPVLRLHLPHLHAKATQNSHGPRRGRMSQSGKNGLTYSDAGVDIDAGNLLVEKIKPLVRSTRRPGADGEIGGFGGLFDLKAAGFSDPVLVAANDGVGTKLKIAIDANKHDTVGIDLVAMCVNDLVVQGAEPLFFLDYFATGKLDPDQGAAIVAGIAAGCRDAGCALIGGETAEMPGMYAGGDYDLAGFAVGAAERGKLLPAGDIAEGDVILGLSSSGVHSNGYSLVRKITEVSGLAWDAPAPFAEGETLAEALMTPTRIYVKPLLAAIRETGAIKALAHITGGGFPENIPRVLPKHLAAEIDLSAIRVPAVFSWLASTGGVAANEMLRTFNCGVGMIAVVAEGDAEKVIAALEAQGETVFALGRMTARADGAAGTIYKGTLAL